MRRLGGQAPAHGEAETQEKPKRKAKAMRLAEAEHATGTDPSQEAGRGADADVYKRQAQYRGHASHHAPRGWVPQPTCGCFFANGRQPAVVRPGHL